MPYEMKDIREVRIGDMSIDISNHPEITEFTYDEEAVNEYIEDRIKYAAFNLRTCELTLTVPLNLILLLKLSGSWDWVIENCPNKRVAHLIKNHKDDRVKMKNFRHATKLIGKILRAPI